VDLGEVVQELIEIKWALRGMVFLFGVFMWKIWTKKG